MIGFLKWLVIDKIEISLGFFGVVFALLAYFEAHKAFLKSKEILRTIAAFKLSFEDIMEELSLQIEKADKSLCLLLPTVCYGYLFGQQKNATKFSKNLKNQLHKISEYLNSNPEFDLNSCFRLRLILIDGNLQDSYLSIADHRYSIKLSYCNETKEILEIIRNIQNLCGKKEIPQEQWPIRVWLLKYDPHIRIAINNSITKNAGVLVSFSQTGVKHYENFESIGFGSLRKEMVIAFVMLYELFIDDAKECVVDDDFIKLFTERFHHMLTKH